MSNLSYSDLRKAICGPVFPIVVPFTEDHSVDLEALSRYVDFLVDKGAPVLLVTVGTSRFNLLTRDEMKAVNKTVVETVAGRSIAIAAGPGPASGSTRENIEFASHAKSIGADGILILYPERWYGDEPVIKFYHEIADSTDIGIMIHALPLKDGFGGVNSKKNITADMIEKISVKENIIGVKEENGERDVFEEILGRLNNKVPIIGAGGAMRRFINDYKLGSRTYLVGIGSVKPELAVEFYDAVISGNASKADEIAKKNEDPFFEFAVKLGWHPALKESLSLAGLMPPYERPPLSRLSIEESERLAELLKRMGWLNNGPIS